MDLQSFRDEMLKEHNVSRVKYGNVAPLALDSHINDEAQEYAQRLAMIDNSLRHSKRTHLGSYTIYIDIISYKHKPFERRFGHIRTILI